MFKTKIMFILLFIVSILILPLTGCSSAPKDDYLISRISDDLGYGNPMLEGMWPTNVSITAKGKCDELSTTAEARGISEAWLISYQYDNENNGNYRNGDGLYTVENGQENFNIRGYSCP